MVFESTNLFADSYEFADSNFNYMKKYILIINAGSSTLKFKVFEFESLKLLKQGIVERIGLMDSFIILNGIKEINEVESHEEAFKLVLEKITELKFLSSP